jgi:hypothetical protein
VRNQTAKFLMDVGRLALAVFAFWGVSGNSVLTLLHTDPPTTAAITHPTFEELSKPNPLLEALQQPQPILGNISGRTQVAEPNLLLGTISAI